MGMFDNGGRGSLSETEQLSFEEAREHKKIATQAHEEWVADGGFKDAIERRKAWTEEHDPELAASRREQDERAR